MRIRIAAFALMICSLFSVSTQAQKSTDKQAKIDMLKAFYTEYITANSKEPADEKEIQAIKAKYCTARLVKELDAKSAAGELDYDPFVSAQDFDMEWLKSLKVEPAVTANVFRVTYDMEFEEEVALIRPVVIKEKGKFKIDDIKND